MGYVSKQTVDSSNNTLAIGNFAQRHALFTSQSICPPSGVLKIAAADYAKAKLGTAEQSIKFIKFRPQEKNELGSLTFVMKDAGDLKTVASRAGWTAIWWLPWASKRIVKIKIRSLATMPQLQIGTDDPIPNPELFFTAAINGCSVFVVGNQDGPSVYHAGVNGALEQRQDHETTEAAWERLVGRQGATSVGKTDYVSELRGPLSGDTDRITSGPLNQKTTRAAAALEVELAKKKQLSNIGVAPFGMVFGMRGAGGNWTMTLVRQATVTYQQLVVTGVKKRFLLPDKKIKTWQGESLRDRTYDEEGNVTKSDQKKQVAKRTTTIVLGHVDFFPGRGVAHMKQPSQIQIY